MKKRLAEQVMVEMAEQFPAVLITGPRQCGKTTLAKHRVKGLYFDLEKAADYEVFADDPAFALNRLKEPLILDEAQNLPSLFSVLRSVIDENRKRNGRFYLLGSVNPALIRQASESLAGRIGTVELTPFLYPEVAGGAMGLNECWLRGGYPDACLESKPERRMRWLEEYSRALVQRDLNVYGLQTSPPEMRRFIGMLSHLHGGLLNASELGRSLGVTYHTTNRYLDILEGHFLVRRLQPWYANLGKRLIKTPKIYLRDTGLLHYLLGIQTENDLVQSPRRGASWEGLLVEQVIALEKIYHTGSQFWFFRTCTGTEIDLMVDRGKCRIGYEFKCSTSVNRADAAGLLAGLSDKVIHKAMLVYAGTRHYQLNDQIDVIPAELLLRNYRNAG